MAGIFAGKYEHSIDAKGRVIVPAIFRDKLGTGFTIMINNSDDALVFYPAVKWEAVYERLVSISDMDEVAMDYKRYLIANAQTEVDMDAQGRVLIPAGLREAVGLSRDVMFVGMLDHTELWDAAAYKEKEKNTKAQIPKSLKHMNERY